MSAKIGGHQLKEGASLYLTSTSRQRALPPSLISGFSSMRDAALAPDRSSIGFMSAPTR